LYRSCSGKDRGVAGVMVAPQTRQLVSPAPISAPQLRQTLGRPE
jgi:hypothetical protein